MDDGTIGECLVAARDVVRQSASPDGWLASASDFVHYASVWCRDAAFTGIAVAFDPDTANRAATRSTLLRLASLQAALGQIPVAYFAADQVWDWGETGNTDGTALFVILGGLYLTRNPGDRDRARLITAMELAQLWLRHQDANNFGLIDSPQASDWMDSTLNRSGKVLYNNVLYYAATRALAAVHNDDDDDDDKAGDYQAQAEEIRRKGNLLFWPKTSQGIHLLLSHVPYPHRQPRLSHHTTVAAYQSAIKEDRWHYVSHVEYGRFVDRCDVLANCLAILFGFASSERSRLIARALVAAEAAEPYPARSWLEPFTSSNDRQGVHKLDAEEFQERRWRNPPCEYHNAAVWPFIGGYLIAALRVAGREADARELLPRLASANALSADATHQWGFHEWINSRNGAPGGGILQTWSAAAFVLAHQATVGELFAPIFGPAAQAKPQ